MFMDRKQKIVAILAYLSAAALIIPYAIFLGLQVQQAQDSPQTSNNTEDFPVSFGSDGTALYEVEFPTVIVRTVAPVLATFNPTVYAARLFPEGLSSDSPPILLDDQVLKHTFQENVFLGRSIGKREINSPSATLFFQLRLQDGVDAKTTPRPNPAILVLGDPSLSDDYQNEVLSGLRKDGDSSSTNTTMLGRTGEYVVRFSRTTEQIGNAWGFDADVTFRGYRIESVSKLNDDGINLTIFLQFAEMKTVVLETYEAMTWLDAAGLISGVVSFCLATVAILVRVSGPVLRPYTTEKDQALETVKAHLSGDIKELQRRISSVSGTDSFDEVTEFTESTSDSSA